MQIADWGRVLSQTQKYRSVWTKANWANATPLTEKRFSCPFVPNDPGAKKGNNGFCQAGKKQILGDRNG